MASTEPERFDALEQVGFKVIRYGDIVYQLYEKFGGHYMDVGASAKIANGQVSKLGEVQVHCTACTPFFPGGCRVLMSKSRSKSSPMLYPPPTPKTVFSLMTERSSKPR
jgi:hypothetical protein